MSTFSTTGTRRSHAPALWLLLVAAPVCVGCYQEPSRFDQVQQQTRGKKATSREAVPGGDLNKFFPRTEGNASVTYTQEKIGMSQAELYLDGKAVAYLSIFDTVSNPEAAVEYKDSSRDIAGFPLRDAGEKGSAILVADRFQVTVRSEDANFTKEDREAWLTKFDLANLAEYARTR
jgi:hypothetical protein